MRNLSTDRTSTVINCKWMFVEGGVNVILSFDRFRQLCVGLRYS